MNLQQYQEEILEKFDNLPNTEMTTREFLISSLKGQLEVVVAGLPKKEKIPNQKYNKYAQLKVGYIQATSYNSAIDDFSTPLLEDIKRK
jgi:hypothetical protein